VVVGGEEKISGLPEFVHSERYTDSWATVPSFQNLSIPFWQ
jgi:hypothetical protein